MQTRDCLSSSRLWPAARFRVQVFPRPGASSGGETIAGRNQAFVFVRRPCFFRDLPRDYPCSVRRPSRPPRVRQQQQQQFSVSVTSAPALPEQSPPAVPTPTRPRSPVLPNPSPPPLLHRPRCNLTGLGSAAWWASARIRFTSAASAPSGRPCPMDCSPAGTDRAPSRGAPTDIDLWGSLPDLSGRHGTGSGGQPRGAFAAGQPLHQADRRSRC